MLYINDPDAKYLTYDDAVNEVIRRGIEPKKAYMYLAVFNIKGAQARVFQKHGAYGQPIKVAVRGTKIITKLPFCDSCKGLVL